VPVASELLVKIGLQGEQEVRAGLQGASRDVTSFAQAATRLGGGLGDAASKLTSFSHAGITAQQAFSSFGD
jgi:hypothetical protein